MVGLRKSASGCFRAVVGGGALLIIVDCIASFREQGGGQGQPAPAIPTPLQSSPPSAALPPVLPPSKRVEEPSLTPRVPTPHRIEKAEVRPPYKRALVVRLESKISESELRALGEHLKSQDSRSFERTFIMYLLPGMVDGEGAWATTHFEPNIRVRVLGMTVEQEKRARETSVMDGYEVLGQWPQEGSGAGIYTLHQKEGRPYVDVVYRDGSKSRFPVKKKKTTFGLRLDPTKKSESGDHWLINSSGNLESRDSEGLINLMLRTE